MIEDQLFAFTRQLIDMDSTTGREGAVGQFLAAYLRQLGGLEVELWEVEPGRYNVFAHRGAPEVVFSTHLDTVPPFFPSREDATSIYGRGACDAKGIAAAQIFAARQLLERGSDNFGLLFVVGEERNSAGALAANLRPPALPPGRPRFLINGEPTGSRMISAGKGVLRMNLSARGRAAHSAYPELGDSAILKLLDALARLRTLPLRRHPQLGEETFNIGVIAGGRAPNVIPDQAGAELMIRLVEDSAALRPRLVAAAGPEVAMDFVLELPPLQLTTLPGFTTGIVAFGTDIPKLTAWGQPVLFGPGSIHVAHTASECIAKAELVAAVGAYARMLEELRQNCHKIITEM